MMTNNSRGMMNHAGSRTNNNHTSQGSHNSSNNGSSNRGFAAMDKATQREISSRGGRAAHANGHAHEFTSSEAREAGRKGGRAYHSNSNGSNNASENNSRNIGRSQR